MSRARNMDSQPDSCLARNISDMLKSAGMPGHPREEGVEFTFSIDDHPEVYAMLMSTMHAAVQGQHQQAEQQQHKQQEEPQVLRDADMEQMGLLMPELLALRGKAKAPADLQDRVQQHLYSCAERALSSSRVAPAQQQRQQQRQADSPDLVSAGVAVVGMAMELQFAASLALQKLQCDADTVKHCQLCLTTITAAATQAANDKYQQLLQQQQVPQAREVRLPVPTGGGEEHELVIDDDQLLPAAFVHGLAEASSLAGKAALMYVITLATYKSRVQKPLEELTAEDKIRWSREFQEAVLDNYVIFAGSGPTLSTSSFSSSSSSAAAAGATKLDGWGQAETFAGLKGLFRPKADSSSSSGGRKAGSAPAAGSSSSRSAAADAPAGPAAAMPGNVAAKGPSLKDAEAYAAAAVAAAAVSAPAQDAATGQQMPIFVVDMVQLKFWTPAHVLGDLPEDLEADAEELAVIDRMRLHVKCNAEGWNALHYAAASHKPKLVQQLLDIGADPTAAVAHLGLTPLHLACMGRIRDYRQLQELAAASTSLYDLQAYAMKSGPACSRIVQLLLDKGAPPGCIMTPRDMNSTAGITPLHLLACWSPIQDDAEEPAASSRSISRASSSSRKADAAATTAAQQQRIQEQLQAYRAVLRSLHACCFFPVAPDTSELVAPCTSVNTESPLTFAAYTGAYEIAEQLLLDGADVNQPRLLDAMRPLDLAVHFEHARLACLLLEHGAEVLPGDSYYEAYSLTDEKPPPNLLPSMLLLNAVQIDDPPHNVRLVAMLLQRNVPLEVVWEESGETALSMAVSSDDVEMVRLLVAAGTKLEAVRRKPPKHTPLFDAAIRGKVDIMQILLDAGADYSSYGDDVTDYDLVQTAANFGQFEAVVKLVEAGATWRLARGQQRNMGGTIYYVPEMLSINKPGLKTSFIEGRLKLAEKMAKQRKDKAAAAAATKARSSTPSPSADSTSKQQQQQQPVADLADIDALAAEIEGLGGGSIAPAAAAATSSSSSSKKGKKKDKEKERKQRAKQQQKQLRSAMQRSREASEGSDEEAEPVAGAAAAAAGNDAAASAADDVSDVLTKLELELEALQGMIAAEAVSSSAVKQQQQQQPKQRQAKQQSPHKAGVAAQQQASKQQQQQAAAAAAVVPAEQQSAEHILARASALLQQEANERQQQLRQQKKEKQQKQRAAAKAAAAAAAAGGQVDKASTGASVGSAAAAATSAVQQPAAPATQPAAAEPLAVPAVVPAVQQVSIGGGQAAGLGASATPPATALPVQPLPAAAPSPAAAAVSGSAAPSVLQSWRGSLNPIFMYNRPVSSGNGTSTPAATAAIAQAAPVAASPAAAPPAAAGVVGLQMPLLQGNVQQQEAAVPAVQSGYSPQQLQPQLRQQWPQQVAQQQQQQQQQPALHRPAMPSAMMRALQSAHQGSSNTAQPQQQQRQRPAAPALQATPTVAGLHAAVASASAAAQKPARQAAGANGSSSTGGAAAGAKAGVGSADTAAGSGGMMQTRKKCIVCMERLRDVLLLPCKHLVLCSGCAEQMEGRGALGSCPYCRQACVKRVRVHGT